MSEKIINVSKDMLPQSSDNKTPRKEKKPLRHIMLTRKWFASPYIIFLAVFVAFPMLLLIFKAFTVEDSFVFTLENFTRALGDKDLLLKFLQSILVAIISTALCLLIAYPAAYFLARSKAFKNPYIVILLLILPMWINFMLRISALKEIIRSMEITSDWVKIVIGMVYDFLPFMILPIYNSLRKMDNSFLEAASDLGANGRQVFTKVVIPLSMPGVMSGITMVFVPVMSAYAVVDAMTVGLKSLFGNLIDTNKTETNYASALALIMSVFIVILLLISSRYERIGDSDGGTLV